MLVLTLLKVEHLLKLGWGGGGGQNHKGASEVTDEATPAVAALQMSVVHHANIRN